MSPSEIDTTLPPVVQAFLSSGAQLESIRLDAEGNWWHQNVLFDNKKLIDLFSASVSRTEGGTWVLEIPPFTYPIEVEETGYFVKWIEVDADAGAVKLHLAGNLTENLDLGSLSYHEGSGFRCNVRGGRFVARFKRSAYYALADHVNLSETGDISITLGSTRHPVKTA